MKSFLKDRQTAEWERVHANDSNDRRAVRNCIRYARMCEAGTTSRLFWLRCALLHNAGRYNNWQTICNLSALTREANVA